MLSLLVIELLCLAPKFGPIVTKKSHPEDSSRKQWEVVVPLVNRSSAFGEGWDAFLWSMVLDLAIFCHLIISRNYSLLLGSLKTFECEKIYFPKNRSQKKKI